MKKQTSELTEAALDWAVAKAEGFNLSYDEITEDFYCNSINADWCFLKSEFKPSTNWAQGGPIIEREEVSLQYLKTLNKWHASIDNGQYIYVRGHRTSPLLAGMRCYVASKLGDEVDIPDELGGA